MRRGRGLMREARLDLLTGAIVVLASAGGQLWLLLGPHPFDPAYYFQLGAEFPSGVRDYWALRIGLLAPVRVAHVLFGPSEAALYAVPVATTVLLAGAVYGTMLALFRDRLLGAAAALVTALNPSWLFNSSFIFPDTTATATFTAGILCLVLGRGGPEQENRGWVPTVAAAGAGVFFGWTYLIREFSPILLPAVAAAVLILRYPLRRAAVVVGAAFATFSLELLYGLVRFGDPLVRFDVLRDRRDTIGPGRQRWMEQLQEQLGNPLDTILVLPRLLLAWNTGWIFLLLLAVFVVGLVRLRDRRLALLAAWLFTFWAAMAVFGLLRVSSGELIVNVTNIRYWYPIFPPLVMGAFGSLGLLAREFVSGRRGALLAVAVPALVAALALIPGTVEFRSCTAKNIWRNEPVGHWDELRSWLARPEAERFAALRTDHHSLRLVPAYTRSTFGHPLWDGAVQKRAARGRVVVPVTGRSDVLLLVHKRFQKAGLGRLRSEWSPVFQSEDGWIVALAHDSATTDAVGVVDQPWWERPRGRGRAAHVGECGLSRFEPRG
ncbi:MAG: hypothetical protein ACRELV_01635 [Longimicrobiales bacterium]